MNPGELIKRSVRKALETTPRGRAYLASRHRRMAAEQHERGVSFYRDRIEPRGLCFDIGANVGNRTEMLREIDARVIAVEPQGSCVRELRDRFADDSDVVVVASALGSSPGKAEIAVCDDDPTISTMSARWQNEGRFSDQTWTRQEEVEVTTMDRLIEEHGSPSFCKIDVEGFEKEVLEGLSAPVRCVSFEFTREFLDDARACVALLGNLGPIEVNVSFGETMCLAQAWTDAETIFSMVESNVAGQDWGDIYVRSS
ncbi:MAG TPA: FkbM family methyltransferase [Solirubrobacterales bacterium]|nr:FkbM family methyltransferase [Solirubrobacterales bacterium]